MIPIYRVYFRKSHKDFWLAEQASSFARNYRRATIEIVPAMGTSVAWRNGRLECS